MTSTAASPEQPTAPLQPDPRSVATPAEPVSASASWALPRGLIVVLSLASLVVLGAGMRSLAGIIGPGFLALIIVITVHPVQAWL